MKTTSHQWLASFLVLGFSTLAASVAWGQNWAIPVSGSYGTPGNWTPPGVPVNPTFDLNSAGYTVTLPSAESAQTLAVQTDNPTLNLNGQTFTLSDVDVSTQTFQTGSLTVLGPGTILANSNNATVSVGGNGTGQLIVNGAAINFQGSNGTDILEGAGSAITVENGGALENAENSASLNGSVVLNDGTLSDESDLALNAGAMLSNGSSLKAVGNMSFNGTVTVDNSVVSSSNGVSTVFHGTLTVSDGGSVFTTGTITLPATTTILSGDVQSLANTFISGTTTIQLSGSTHDPFSGASMGHYGGVLDFTLQNSFVPVIGEQFDIFDYLGGGSGVFSAVNLPALNAGESWDTSNLYTTGVIRVVPEPAGTTLVVAMGVGVLLRRKRGRKTVGSPI